MSSLFDAAFARLDHAQMKRTGFGSTWSTYIDAHPWDAMLREAGDRSFEIVIVVDKAAPATMSLLFSDWLSALRAALDNGLYALAVAISGQNPPPAANKLQFPITTTPADFRQQAKRLDSLPPDIVAKLEKAQPYQSPYGCETNLLFWLHELARIDRHRAMHVGLGCVAEHRVRVRVPHKVDVIFDETVKPFNYIDDELVVARFIVSEPVKVSQIAFNPGVTIDPEIKEWARFRLNGHRQPLNLRMRMTELFMRNHLENLALTCGEEPPDGFNTFGSHDDDAASET